mmetsp:Transcript_614/g.2261  ORF Transcript_614/g.2261 Transcript_614/m.2261 type:complete len:273 (+) Transcript_614:775-1593(+)
MMNERRRSVPSCRIAGQNLGLDPLVRRGHRALRHLPRGRHEPLAVLRRHPHLPNLLLNLRLGHRVLFEDASHHVPINRLVLHQRGGDGVDCGFLPPHEPPRRPVLHLHHLPGLDVGLVVPIGRRGPDQHLHRLGSKEILNLVLVNRWNVVELAALEGHARRGHHHRRDLPGACRVRRRRGGQVVEAVVLLLGELRHKARAKVPLDDRPGHRVGSLNLREVLQRHASVHVGLPRGDRREVELAHVLEEDGGGHRAPGVYAGDPLLVLLSAVHR